MKVKFLIMETELWNHKMKDFFLFYINNFLEVFDLSDYSAEITIL